MGDQQDQHGCDWGLSLSLKPPAITHLQRKPTCKREPQFSLDEQSPKIQKPDIKSMMMMPRMMGLNMKPSPLVIDLEEVEMAKESSPNSTLSSSSGKRPSGFNGERDMISDDEDGGHGGGTTGSGSERERKKLRLTKEQIMVLEQAFKEHSTLNTKQKVTLARQVNLRPRQVEVWFQNRRARTKLKQTEVDCEYLKNFCQTLTEENRKLQKELQELRALKGSHDQSLMHTTPTTLAMCPSCKSVSLSSNAKAPTNEINRYFHRPVPLNIKKLSLTINSNRMFDSPLTRA